MRNPNEPHGINILYRYMIYRLILFVFNLLHVITILIIDKIQKAVHILAAAYQRFDFQTVPGKPSSAFVSSALPTRPRRRASSNFHH